MLFALPGEDRGTSDARAGVTILTTSWLFTDMRHVEEMREVPIGNQIES